MNEPAKNEPAPPLRLVRISLARNRLYAQARAAEKPLGDPDFLVSEALRGLFGDAWPRPFVIEQAEGARLSVLAYAAHGEADLLRAAGEGPAERRLLLEDLRTRPAGEPPAGQKLRFRVRTCPVRRPAREGERGGAPGGEVDAFVLRCRMAGPEVAVDREAVYRDFLAEQVAGRGGAKILTSAVAAYRKVQQVRPRQGQAPQVAERPEAVLIGVCEVTDGAGFLELLRKGIGRHRTYGFGMFQIGGAAE